MKKLLIVANRLPITIKKDKESNKLEFQPSVGGLATGLNSLIDSYSSLWIGWMGLTLNKINLEEKDLINERLFMNNCSPVYLSKEEIQNYYYGFSNNTIWPLFHYFPLYTDYKKCFWESYQEVNEKFCQAVCKIAKPDDIIWIQDYQLMLLPNLIRQKLPDASIGFFLHIPFPSSEIFSLLPWRKEILEGILGADLIGFHVYDYVRHFLNSIRRILGYENTLGQIIAGHRVVRVDAFPMGIDYERFANSRKDPEVLEEFDLIEETISNRKIILSIDRLDYSKGILQRLEAFDDFLDNNPEYIDKVTLILIVNPSRTGIKNYDELRKQIDETVGRINGKFGKIGWMPIWYISRFVPFNTLYALYNRAEIALITPIRDGMNLVAKEFIASKVDGKGVLILSELTGAVRELGEAIIVNPNNKEQISKAIKLALELPEEEQIRRNRLMQDRLKRYNISRWANDFLEVLEQIKEEQVELHATKFLSEMKNDIIQKYHNSKKRIIFLDHDGTLVPISERPEIAKPDEELLKILKDLSEDPKNEIYIISGRDKKTLSNWYDLPKIGVIAEHGAWLKESSKDWKNIWLLNADWKDEIRPKLELFVDRTPGSFIEEKEFSLAWHFRKSEHALATRRAMELKDALYWLTANLNLSVLEGKKVIEVRDATINKGAAVINLIKKVGHDFILAIGDDQTDEDMFSSMPEDAISIKVSQKPSKALYNIESVEKVRAILSELTKS
ncbi:MAG: bifunctional alpha,alpha-trehalose-phosphate synthase (UDP-forming)/trehalose-phosphatase [Candidatus Lokiarchaeota archaeon]|nr:bifunctional alpha,alpha-trehalose-phosphate synthase (UDP-forming)/trehalose-phosphatase [Candidatus Lokiarchaeota archaeon]